MKRRIYTDTSVIGGWIEREFKDDSKELFEEFVKGTSILVYSDYVIAELDRAPQNVLDKFYHIPKDHTEFIEDKKEIAELAKHYHSEKVVPLHCEIDAFHIATATVSRVDVLVSWNFKHIVNLSRIQGYNSVNLKLGYPQIDIRTPKETIIYED